MAQGNNGRFPTRPKTALDDLKWRLYGDKLEGGKSRPSFSFYQKTNGNPRVDVWLNNGAEGDKGRIQLDLDPWAAEAMFTMLQRAIDSKQELKLKLDVKVSFMYGKKLDKPEVKGSIIVGRNAEGRIYIGVVERNKPPVRFFFDSPNWFDMVDGEGNKVRPELNDELWARAWVNGVSRLWSIVFEKNWKEPERKDDNGDRGNNRNNSDSKPSADFDDAFDDSW